MNQLNLAPEIQEAILFLPRPVKGRDPIREKDIRPIAAVLVWRKQRKIWKLFQLDKNHSLANPSGRILLMFTNRELDKSSLTLYHVIVLKREDPMAQKKITELLVCSLKPALEDRSLISSEETGELVALFKVLANDTRLRLIHALARSGELCVTDLAAAVGMKPQAVSNQLQRLSDRGILKTRRDGNNIHYRIVDPCVLRLLELGLCLIEEAEPGPRTDGQ